MTEETDVKAVYDRIATHFSKTRAYPWSEIESFLSGQSGDIGLDIGCGNGRHLEVLVDHVDRAIGIDVSRAILHEGVKRAHEKGFEVEFLQGSATKVPVKDETIEISLFIAAMHHLRTRSERLASLGEMARVLTPEGVGLISVWSTTHERFDRERGFDTQIDWTLPDGETVPRFYHIYDPEEFEADVEASALTAAETFVSSGNCFAIVRSE